MKKKLLVLASAALLLTTQSFADCRKDTVNFYNIPAGGAKTQTARNISTFDAQGNQLTELRQINNSGTWNNNRLKTITYNSNNKVLVYLEQLFNAGTSAWDNSKKYENSYTGANLVDTISSTWNPSSSIWEENARISYTYTTQGKVASAIVKLQGVNNNKVEYTYDASQNETKKEFFGWSSGAWIPNSKEERTYNANNKVSTLTNFGYNQGTMTYTNGQQFAYTYDANNNETQREGRDWNGSAYTATIRFGTTWSNGKIAGTFVSANQGTWTTVEQSFYAYDANGNVSSITKQTLQQSTPGNPPTLQNESRIEYAYNSSNQETRKSNQIYNKTTMQFSTTYEEVRNYSASGKLARFATFSIGTNPTLLPVNETLYEFNTDDDLVAIETRTGFNVNQGGFNSVTREEYVCGRAATPNGIQAIRESKLSVYPNPAVGTFLLETDAKDAMVIITDLVGKVVFEKQLEGDKMTISVADFNTGLYIVKIQGKSENASRKLIVGK